MFLDRIGLHGRAFDAGYISRQRLICVLVEPFFLLAEKVSQAYHEQPSGFPASMVSCQKKTRDLMLEVWGESLIRTLSESAVVDGDGVPRCNLEVSHGKRAKLIKALSKANFFQVSEASTLLPASSDNVLLA